VRRRLEPLLTGHEKAGSGAADRLVFYFDFAQTAVLARAF
jgi:hypothetical protein